MRQVNIHQAKTHFSELVAAVEAGEEIIIARAGKRIARLVADTPTPKRYRTGGSLAGKIRWDQAAWDEGDAEIAALFGMTIDGEPTT